MPRITSIGSTGRIGERISELGRQWAGGNMFNLLSRNKRRQRRVLSNRNRRFRGLFEKLEERALMAAFTTGNIVVERLGDGTTTLGSAAAQVNLLEVAPGGSVVQTLTTQFTGGNLQTDSGSASSNGNLNINGRFLAVPGHNAAVSTASVASLNNKVGQIIDGSTSAPDVVSRVLFPTGGPTGTPPSPFSGDNFRSIIATSSTTFYATGTASGTPNTGGVWYYNGSGFTQLSTTVTNLRNVEIYNNQLYVSSANGSFLGISSVGTGLPTTSGQTITLRIDMGAASPYGFVLFDTDNNGSLDRAYIADDRNTNSNGGINRFDFNGTIWSRTSAFRFDTSTGTLSSATTGVVSIRGLTGSYDTATGTATLFATTTEASNNRLIRLLDTSTAWSTSTSFTTLQNAGANYVFRGLDIYSVPDTSPPTLTFDDGDGDDAVLVNETLNYTLTFNEDINASTVTAGDFDNAGTATISIGAISETSPGIFTVAVTPSTTGTVILRIPSGAVIQDNAGNALVVPVQDDTTVNVSSGDTTPPTVSSIDDGDADDVVAVNVALTYTITFSEDIDGATVEAADFNNNGTASISIGSITETSPGIFSVVVTPSSGGTLRLRIVGTIKDIAGNNLAVPVSDNDTLNVDVTPPTITNITNSTTGFIPVESSVTYTILFSEDIDASTVTSAVFTNAGTASVNIGSITEVNPGEFRVIVTPTTTGTLLLRIPASAVISDVVGNTLSVPQEDDETINVTATTTLSPGDVSIIGYRTVAPDAVAFVTWVALLPGTRITFWDHGYIGGGDGTGTGIGGGTWRTSENLARWVNGLTTVPAGTVVVLSASSSPPNGIADIGTMEGQLDGLSSSGDQIFVGQGSFTGPVNNQNFIGTLVFGADFSGAAGWDAAAADSNTSGLPSVLNAAGRNISFAVASDPGNREYTGTRDFTNFSLAQSALANLSNYSSVGSTASLNSTDFAEVPDTVPPTVSFDDGDLDDSVSTGTTLTYTLTFSEDIQASTISASDFDNAGTSSVIIGSVTETAPGIVSVQVTPNIFGTLILRIKSSANVLDLAGNKLVVPVQDDTSVSVTSGDATPPTVVSIDDGDADNIVKVGDVLTYVITFDEDIDASSVTAADFANNGAAGISIGAITEPTAGIFNVTVTTTSAGPLTLSIVGTIVDVAGNPLLPPVNDDTTLTVDGTAPSLLSITDNTTGSTVQQGVPVIYTLSFSEDIDLASVQAADFNNAGTATIAVGSITETTAGVLTVSVTPSTAGTLILRLPSGATITDVAGNPLTVPVQDDTTITVTPVTTLVAGDIVVIGYDASGSPDKIALLFLKELLPGTRFFVNDNEVAAVGGASFTDISEAEATFVVKEGQTIPAGTVVILPWGNQTVTDDRFTWTGHTGGGLAVSSGSIDDGIYIYTGSSATALTPTAFIFYARGGSNSANAGNIPAGLSFGSTAINLTAAASRYKTSGSVYNGVPSQLRSAIGDVANNWISGAPGAPTDWTFQIGATFTGAQVNGGAVFTNANQRSQVTSLVVNFATAVSLQANAFSIENIGLLTAGSSFIPQSQLIITPSSGSSASFTITFDAGTGSNGTNVNGVIKRNGGANATTAGNSLEDGNYVLRIDRAKVSGEGFSLVGDAAFGDVAVDRFFRLYGDGDGDGDVDGTDNVALRLAQSAYNAAFDWDGNGSVSAGADITNFTANRNKRRRSF